MIERTGTWLRMAMIAVVVTVAAPAAHADEVDDIKQLIAGRGELASLTGKVITKEGTGTYRIAAGSGPLQVRVVKTGTGWAIALAWDKQPPNLAALLPASVAGNTAVTSAFVVIAASSGSFDASLIGATGTSNKLAFSPGVTMFAQLTVGSTGTLGQLATAGILPAKPMWLIGATGGGLAEALLAGNAPKLDALDFSLTLQLPSFVPAPFTLIASPKLTFGDAKFTFTRTRGAFSLSGEQTNSKLLIGSRTITIPRTSLTFTSTANGSYDVTVAGSGGETWHDAFGLVGADLKSVSVSGTISSTKTTAAKPPIKGFALGLGARLTIAKRDYDGTFSISIVDNKLHEMALALSGELNLGFLPGGKDFTFKQFGLAFTPASQQAALAGELQWRTLNGRAAVVLSQEPMLLLGLKGLDLTKLLGTKPAGMPALPPVDVLLTAGFAAKAGNVVNLPSVAQALIDEVTGSTGGKIKVPNGLGIVTRLDAKALGGSTFGVSGPMLLAGSLDVLKGSFRIAASLTTIPAIPGLPKGFSVEAPELFLAVDQRGGAPVASGGLALRLILPVDAKQRLAFKGSMSVSSAGTFAFTGMLETNWENPFGLTGLTILAPVVVSVGVGADASIDLGFQAGASIAKQTYNPMAMCVNLQAAAPVPIPKKLAIKFKGSELGPQVALEILEALVKSVIDGPLKSATTDPATKKALAAMRPSVDKISEVGSQLGIPSFAFKAVDFAITTPGVTCEIPAIEGMGIKLAGTATYQNKPLGSLDCYANLTQGFKIASKINDIDLLGLVKVSNAQLDVLAPMPGAAPAPSAADAARADTLKAKLNRRTKELASTNKAIKKEKDADDKAELVDERDDLEKEIADLKKQIARATTADLGHFYLMGKTEIMRSSAAVKIMIDKMSAEFGFRAELADLGTLNLTAATEGENLAKATDFEIGLGVEDVSAKLLAKLGAALKASAAARKQAQGDVSKGTDAAIKAAQAERDRLDAKAGKEYRAAARDFKKAKIKLKKAKRAIRKAKNKCEEDLGVAAELCGAMDAATETLKVARKTLDASQDTLRAIKKSADYVRLKAVTATIATLKAGNNLVQAGLGGWAAVDRIGQLVIDGAATGLVTIDEVDLTGSLRTLTGTLDVTVVVGESDVEKRLEFSLAPGILDVTELAEDVADEITEQAAKQDSPVWKQLRKAQAKSK